MAKASKTSDTKPTTGKPVVRVNTNNFTDNKGLGSGKPKETKEKKG